MCGLYAIIDKFGDGFDESDLNVFAQMAIMTQLRGMHNSGVYAVDRINPKNAARIVKTVGHSHNLVYEKGWESWLKFAKEKAGILVGHGRYATVGKITKANGHPFKSNHITLVHNGTIRSGLDATHTEEVDSHNLCKQIAIDGFDEALKNIVGAYAIIAHDESTGKIVIAKNYERPLAFLETKDRIYIMSHDKALEYLYTLNNSMGYGKINTFASEKKYEFDFHTKKLEIAGDLGKVYKPTYGGTYYDYSKSNTPVISEKPAPTENKGCAYQVEEDIIFQVTKIIAPEVGNVYTYVCTDEDKNKIFFKTDSNNPEWLDQWGMGKCCMKTYNTSTSQWLYQIKTRSIDWDAYQVEESEMIPLADGDSVTKAKWQELCAKEVCSFCNGPIYENENEDTLSYEQHGKLNLVCKHCMVHNKSLLTIGTTL